MQKDFSFFSSFGRASKTSFIVAMLAASGIVSSCSDDRRARIAPDYMQEQGEDQIQNPDQMQFNPNMQSMQNEGQMPTNMQMNMPSMGQGPVDVEILSNEYASIAKLYEAKNGIKQKDYFLGKADSVIKTGVADIEVLPTDIIAKNKSNEKILRLSLRENVAKQKTTSGELDGRLAAKIIATYDCAVVDAIESTTTASDPITSCYEEFISITEPFKDINEDSIVSQNIPSLTNSSGQNGSGAMAQVPTGLPVGVKIQPYQILSSELKPFTEQVSKTFFVAEFDKMSSSLDISYYEKFKSVSSVLQKYPNDYSVTIIGFELYSEDPFTMVKNKRGVIKKVKRSPAAIMAAKKVNEMLKVRALTVRKMLVSNGVNENNIIIAHPEQQRVKFLYNIKDGANGENVLENLIIIDIKPKEDAKPNA